MDEYLFVCGCSGKETHHRVLFRCFLQRPPSAAQIQYCFFFPCATLLRHKDDHRRSISRPHAFIRQRKTSLWQVHCSCLCLKGSDGHSHSHEDTTRRLCRAAYHERVRRVTSRRKTTLDLCGGGGGSHRSRDQCVRVARQIHDETRGTHVARATGRRERKRKGGRDSWSKHCDHEAETGTRLL